jgi:hypothetical protein
LFKHFWRFRENNSHYEMSEDEPEALHIYPSSPLLLFEKIILPVPPKET